MKRDWMQKTVQTREQMQDEPVASAAENATEPKQTQKTRIVRKRKAAEPTSRSSRGGKRSDPAYTQVSAYVLGRVYDDVMVRLIQAGRKQDFSDLVGELLEGWLRRQKS